MKEWASQFLLQKSTYIKLSGVTGHDLKIHPNQEYCLKLPTVRDAAVDAVSLQHPLLCTFSRRCERGNVL